LSDESAAQVKAIASGAIGDSGAGFRRDMR